MQTNQEKENNKQRNWPLETVLGNLMVAQTQNEQLANRLSEWDSFNPLVMQRSYEHKNEWYRITVSFEKLSNKPEFDIQRQEEEDLGSYNSTSHLSKYNPNFANLVGQFLVTHYQVCKLRDRLTEITWDNFRDIRSRSSGFVFKHDKDKMWYKVDLSSSVNQEEQQEQEQQEFYRHSRKGVNGDSSH